MSKVLHRESMEPQYHYICPWCKTRTDKCIPYIEVMCIGCLKRFIPGKIYRKDDGKEKIKTPKRD